jgi:RHS repeat-associated protein
VKFGPATLVINYAYQHKDHLGNIRLNYGKDPETNVLRVLEENHYYPFGLKHQNYNTGRRQLGKKEEILAGNLTLMPAFVLPTEDKPMAYKYKYNGKEFQDELGLNMYDYGARNYDPALGRWMNIDPLAEQSRRWSPYTYAYNNPILFIDPDGMQAKYNWEEHDKGNVGIYTDGDKNVSFEEALSQVNEEPPVNLFKPTKLDKSQKIFNDVFDEANKPENYQVGDMNFSVYGHGSEVHIGDNKHNPDRDFYTAKEFDEAMKELSPAYKKVGKMTVFTLTLYTCQSASGDNPMAMKISNAHPNANIIGFDGFVGFGTSNGRPAITKVSENVDMKDSKGFIVTYINGKEVSRVLYSQYIQGKK